MQYQYCLQHILYIGLCSAVSVDAIISSTLLCTGFCCALSVLLCATELHKNIASVNELVKNAYGISLAVYYMNLLVGYLVPPSQYLEACFIERIEGHN